MNESGSENPLRGRRASSGEAGAHGRETALSALVHELRLRAERPQAQRRRPRLGFVGLEWSRLSRLRDLAHSGLVDVRTLVDPSPDLARDAAAQIRNVAPNVRVLRDVDTMLQEPLDGVVVGGPARDHARHARAALARGFAVFCQHPLAESAREAQELVTIARQRDRLLGVDFRYRQVPGVAEMAALVRDGEIGEVFAADLVYHSAFGPEHPGDADDGRSPTAGSSGCLLELGSHLVDLALHVLDVPALELTEVVSGRRYASGRLLDAGAPIAEDHATAELLLGRGVTTRIACSWRASIGQEAVIEATFTGTRGALRLRNVHGSFNAFRVEHCEGTRCRTVGGTLDAWSGRVACAWARRLAADPGYDESADRIPLVATIIERIAGQGAGR